MSRRSSQTSSPSSSLKTYDLDDDRKSTFSQGSGVPRADGAVHALQLIAGNRVRHGRCAPEFLEDMATRGANDSLRRFMAKKFKVMSGQEARLFFRNYIRCGKLQFNQRCCSIHKHSSEHRKSMRNTNEVMRVRIPSPIAFAVTVWDGSVKCVDYYMTWRGFKVCSCSITSRRAWLIPRLSETASCERHVIPIHHINWW